MESHTADDAPADADLEGLLETKDQEISRLLGVLREQAAVLETLKTLQTTTTALAQETQSKLQQELAQVTAEADKARALAYTHQQEASRLITIQSALEERNKHLVDGLDSLHKQNAAGHGTLQSSVAAGFTATQTGLATAQTSITATQAAVTSAKTEIQARIDKLPAHTETFLKDLTKNLSSRLESFQTQVTAAHDKTQASQNELTTLTASLAERIRLLEHLAQIQIQASTLSAEKSEQLTSAIQQQHEQQTRRLDLIVDQLMTLLNSRFVRWPLIAKTWLTSAPKQK